MQLNKNYGKYYIMCGHTCQLFFFIVANLCQFLLYYNMMEDLFGTETRTAESIVGELNPRLAELVSRLRLPPRSLVVRDNKGKIARSWTVCVNEPPYPMPAWEVAKETYALSPIYNFSAAKTRKAAGSLVVKCAAALVKAAPAPEAAMEGNDNCAEVFVPMSAQWLLDWLVALAEAGAKRYRSSAQSFGCCDRYVECSDKGECVHGNLLYSTACAYRRNLEAGRIFYGEKANV